MKKTLFIVTLLVLPLTVNAQCNGYECSGVTNTFIQSLKTSQDSVMLGFPAGINATLNCELYRGGYAKINANSALFSSQHSILLTALASNSPITIQFDNSESLCNVSEVEIHVTE